LYLLPLLVSAAVIADTIRVTETAMTTPDSKTAALPDNVKDLQTTYGEPSAAGFGSAVFFEPQPAADDLETAALDKYKHFVGKSWTPEREAAWLGAWRKIYTRPSGDRADIIAELRAISDRAARSSVTMLLDSVDNPDQARQALTAAFDDAAVLQLAVYNLGDGEAMSGLLIAARRDDSAAVFLVFLLD
jgi:hypothetical protein